MEECKKYHLSPSLSLSEEGKEGRTEGGKEVQKEKEEREHMKGREGNDKNNGGRKKQKDKTNICA